MQHCVNEKCACVQGGEVRPITSGQLADPLVLCVAGQRHDGVGQVAVHGTVPPVILLVLILYEGGHHLRQHTRQDSDGLRPLNGLGSLCRPPCTYGRTIRPLPGAGIFRVSFIQTHPEPAALCSEKEQKENPMQHYKVVQIVFTFGWTF